MKNHKCQPKSHTGSKVLMGLFFILFGVLFMMERAGYEFATWVVSWKTILIAFGIVSLVKHRFQHLFFGLVLIGVGVTFILNDYYPQFIDTRMILPAVIILAGVFIIGKATNIFGSRKKKSDHVMFDEQIDVTSEDYIEATTYFGGINKNITSKSFQGGDFTTVFGGAELNLSKADIQHPVVINTSTIFGGIKIIVPSNWQVNSEITTMFGSVEDQRSTPGDHQIDTEKTITLKGNCFFGGVEIQSYI